MKRIFTILIFLSLSIVGFGQVMAPKGITVGTGASKKVLSVAELGYIDGTTSSIQTQLNTIDADLNNYDDIDDIAMLAVAVGASGNLLTSTLFLTH